MNRPENLPPLPKLPCKEMAGPTPWSNWVIPNRIIAGAYPATLDDMETDRILTTLLELGINTFVCLQAEVNINTPEHAWRNGHGLRPYIKDAQKILSKAHETGNPKISQQKIDFLHLPIVDGNVTTDSALSRLAEDCCERVLKGEKMYVHCWGGHGRTGTLIAVMLGRLYGLPYTTALRYTQALHDSRIYPQGVRSPQTPVQRAQVRRLLTAQGSTGSPISVPMSPVPTVKGNAPVGKLDYQGDKYKKSPTSILASPTRQAEVASRNPVTPSSPLRSRPAVASGAPNRYPARPTGESPMRSSAQDRSSSVDRMSSDFNRLSTNNNSIMSGARANLPFVPQKPVGRGAGMYNSPARRPLQQEVNVR